MGFLKGIVGMATSPVTLVGKTFNQVFDKEWEID